MSDKIREIPRLQPYERSGKTRAQMAEDLGISEQHLRKLLAKERSCEAEWSQSVEKEELDIPHLALSDGASARGDYYDLRTDVTSRDAMGGEVRIGNHNGTRILKRRIGAGKPVEVAKEQKPKKFRPKRSRKRA